MNVVLAMCGDVVVDDDIHMWDVQTPGCHVCRQQNRPGLGLELVQARQPLVLVHLAVQGDGGEAQAPVEVSVSA